MLADAEIALSASDVTAAVPSPPASDNNESLLASADLYRYESPFDMAAAEDNEDDLLGGNTDGGVVTTSVFIVEAGTFPGGRGEDDEYR